VVFVPHEGESVKVGAGVGDFLGVRIELLRVRSVNEKALSHEDPESTSIHTVELIGGSNVGAFRGRFMVGELAEEGDEVGLGNIVVGRGGGFLVRAIIEFLVSSFLVVVIDVVDIVVVIVVLEVYFEVDLVFDVDVLVGWPASSGWHCQIPKFDLVIM
jgi:hypothetical protein